MTSPTDPRSHPRLILPRFFLAPALVGLVALTLTGFLGDAPAEAPPGGPEAAAGSAPAPAPSAEAPAEESAAPPEEPPVEAPEQPPAWVSERGVAEQAGQPTLVGIGQVTVEGLAAQSTGRSGAGQAARRDLGGVVKLFLRLLLNRLLSDPANPGLQAGEIEPLAGRVAELLAAGAPIQREEQPSQSREAYAEAGVPVEQVIQTVAAELQARTGAGGTSTPPSDAIKERSQEAFRELSREFGQGKEKKEKPKNLTTVLKAEAAKVLVEVTRQLAPAMTAQAVPPGTGLKQGDLKSLLPPALSGPSAPSLKLGLPDLPPKKSPGPIIVQPPKEKPPTVQPPTPDPKTHKLPSPDPSLVAGFNWQMEERFGVDRNSNDMIDLPNTREYVYNLPPGTCATTNCDLLIPKFNVFLSGFLKKKESGNVLTASYYSYAWEIAGPGFQPPQNVFSNNGTFQLPMQEGTYQVKVTVTSTVVGMAPVTASQEITIKDLLIVAMGDGIASGEGNPERKVIKEETWTTTVPSSNPECGAGIPADHEICQPTILTAGRLLIFHYWADDGSIEGKEGNFNTFVGTTWGTTGEVDPSTGGYLPPSFPPWLTTVAKTTVGREHLRSHRSTIAWPAQAALAMERRDPHTSVTFISVAASGARIDYGLLEPYSGALNEALARKLPPMPSQIQQVKTLIGARPIDALLLSVGVNEVAFGNVLSALTANGAYGVGQIKSEIRTAFRTGKWGPVNEEMKDLDSLGNLLGNIVGAVFGYVFGSIPIPGVGKVAEDIGEQVGNYDSAQNLKDAIKQGTLKSGLNSLPDHFKNLNDAIYTQLKNVAHVYVSEFPNPTSHWVPPVTLAGQTYFGNVYYCDEVFKGEYTTHFDIATVWIDSDEMAWLDSNIVQPLNAEIRLQAQSYGWRSLDTEHLFINHGYMGASSPSITHYAGRKSEDKDFFDWPTAQERRWFVRLDDSKRNMASKDGTMMPNHFGHRALSERFLAYFQVPGIIVVDGDDQIIEAKQIPGNAVIGVVDSPNDVDMYKLYLTKNEMLDVEINPYLYGEKKPTTDLVPRIRLFNAGGTALKSSTFSCPSQSSGKSLGTCKRTRLEFQSNTPGWYFLGVSDDANAAYNPITGQSDKGGPLLPYEGGDYMLTVARRLGAPDNTMATATPLALTGLQMVVKGHGLEIPQDVDMFRLTLPAKTVRLMVGATWFQRPVVSLPGAMGQMSKMIRASEAKAEYRGFDLSGERPPPFLRIFDATGREVARAVGILSMVPTPGATYYLGVSAPGRTEYDPRRGVVAVRPGETGPAGPYSLTLQLMSGSPER